MKYSDYCSGPFQVLSPSELPLISQSLSSPFASRFVVKLLTRVFSPASETSEFTFGIDNAGCFCTPHDIWFGGVLEVLIWGGPTWRKIFRVFMWDNGYIFSVDKNIFPAVGVLSTKDERSTQMSNEFPQDMPLLFRPVHTRDLLFFRSKFNPQFDHRTAAGPLTIPGTATDESGRISEIF